MRNSKTLEVIVGLFVVAGLLSLAFLAYRVSKVNQVATKDSYELRANFESVSGLKEQAPVSMAGVKIGFVKSISLSIEDYDAEVVMVIDEQFNQMPTDTSASILTAGILGEKYVGLDAGGSDEFLKDGDAIELTKSSLVIERLIDQFLYDFSNKK